MSVFAGLQLLEPCLCKIREVNAVSAVDLAGNAADALCALITEKPDLSQFIPSEATTATEEPKPQEPEPQEAVAPEEAAEKVAPSSAPPVSATQMGFQIQTDILGESVKEDIEEKEPAGLFRKRNK